jgi:hypothetical protein
MSWSVGWPEPIEVGDAPFDRRDDVEEGGAMQLRGRRLR